MSCEATLYFKSGRVCDKAAPHSVDPDGKFVFGRNFPRLVDLMDQSARELGVVEPSQFVWHNPLFDEGELDKISNEQLEAIKKKHEATMLWIPLAVGINTFEALASRDKFLPEHDTLIAPAYYLSFEVTCYRVALEEAAKEGEEAFHIQCY